MTKGLFGRFADFIRDADDGAIERELLHPNRLLVDARNGLGKSISVCFAPFDFVNGKADVVIVGLTPGRQQARNALIEARRVLRAGGTLEEAQAAAKVHASFSGAMRSNLVAMLDRVGVASLVGVDTTARLWSSDSHRVQFTSVLRYPVFVNGQNYSGTPPIERTPFLQQQLEAWMGAELRELPNAVFVPLGPAVSIALEKLAAREGIDPSRILSGLPHPSGANAERIAFFLDRKQRIALSSKVDPEKILAGRASVLSRLANLGVQS